MTERKSVPPRKRENRHVAVAAGKIDKVGRSGVYPMSGPHPRGNAPVVWPGSWGQGKRGPAGYEDHGESELNLKRVTPEKCRDMMTKDPAFCQKSDPAIVAAKLMQAHNIGAVPVVEDRHHPVLAGILTDRDLAVRLVAAGLDPHKTPVETLMSHPVVTCSPDDDCKVAVALMEKHRIKRIAAIDRSRHVVGMISLADVALQLPAKTAEVATELVQPV